MSHNKDECGKNRSVTFFSLIPLEIGSLAFVLMMGGGVQTVFVELISFLANSVVAAMSMILALFITGNKAVFSLKKIALYSFILVIIGDVYSLLASIFLNASQSPISSPLFAEFFAPKYYDIITQFLVVIAINFIVLSLLFIKINFKYKFFIILVASLINSPWFFISQQQSDYSSYTGNKLADVSQKEVSILKEQIQFEEKGVQLVSLPELESTYKTLVTTFEITVPQSGSYRMNMSIHRESEMNSPEAKMYALGSAGDPHGTYYINDEKTDWYNAPQKVNLQQGKNTIVVKIPFVYTEQNSGKLNYNLFPNTSDNKTFGPYILQFDINEFEGENGTIEFGEMQSPDGFQYFKQYPSLSINTFSYKQTAILNN
jgi:hypothetical protein